MGFTSAGILAGSPAAAAMSAAAVANGGGVASFSAVAGLQSVGAVGLATSTAAGMAVLGTICVGGGAVGAGAVWARRKYLQRQDRLRRARWSALPSVVTWSAHPLAAPGGPGAERASPGMGARGTPRDSILQVQTWLKDLGVDQVLAHSAPRLVVSFRFQISKWTCMRAVAARSYLYVCS